MSYLDSPISQCEKIHEYVLTDCSQKECAEEHHCPKDCDCPIQNYFNEKIQKTKNHIN